VKVLLFAVLLALAARNKLALVPALARADLRALPALRRNLMLEYALVCTVLTATALLTGLFSPAAGAS
jgi:putative copper export protein